MKIQKQISKLRKYVNGSLESVSSHAIFKNKYLFYLAVLLASIRLLDYVVKLQITHIFYYFLTALSVYFFTDNVTIVCLVTFLVTSFCLCNYSKEGLENQVESPEKPPEKAKSFVAPQLMTPPMVKEGDPETLPVAESLQNKTTDNKKKTSRLDYASTIEDSYKMLDKMLTTEGIQNLTTDTKSLMNQQKKLGQMMEGMKPLMQSAQELLKQFNPTGPKK